MGCSASVDAPPTSSEDDTSHAPTSATNANANANGNGNGNTSSTAQTTGATLPDPTLPTTPPTGSPSPNPTPTTTTTTTTPPPPPPGVTAAAILAKLATCTKASSAPYAKDNGSSANIDVCQLTNALFFKADMDVDCDGKTSSSCNKSADPDYQTSTAAADSHGDALDAAALPYIVVPGVSSRWSYKTAGVGMGTVVAVIYGSSITYGIVGDVGPTSIIGEASYAMAKSLGINPNPSTGGIGSGVTYVLFPNAKVSKNEDNAEAVTIGEARAQQLLNEN